MAFFQGRFHPFAQQHELDWVPKLRYPIMRSYLPTRGRYGLDMMRRTATVHQIKEENRALRQRQETLAAEKTTLLSRNEQVRTRVEAMIGRLKSMEHSA